MFHLDGKQSDFAKGLEPILGSLGPLTDPDRDDSFAVVVYRVEPLDRYEYVSGFAGLRDPSPMYGPRRPERRGRWDDPRGFRSREGIAAEDCHRRHTITSGDKSAVLWISRRRDAQWASFDSAKAKLRRDIEKLLGEIGSDAPLFPELWHRERELRDRLRSAVASLGHRPNIEEVAQELNDETGQSFRELLQGGHVRTAIHLYTGQGWERLNLRDSALLPHTIERTYSDSSQRRLHDFGHFSNRAEVLDSENLFEWVHCSLRPLLIHPEGPAHWKERIRVCGISLPDSDFALCLAPILDFAHHSRAIGILTVIAWQTYPPLLPAHVFLVSRLALSMSGYLGPLLPIPGFPWWPDAKLSRGQNVRIDRSSETVDHRITGIVKNLVPTGANVVVSRQAGGLTGAHVYRVEVHDEKEIAEVPRILKVGSAESISDELWRYNRYVHNKACGGHARIDIARGYPDMEWNGQRGTAAILYMLVGQGEKAESWQHWAASADPDKVVNGIELLTQQLRTWHDRARTASKLGATVITDAILEKQSRRAYGDRPSWDVLSEPSIKETLVLLRSLRARHNGGQVQTCVAHGDPHCNNLFSLLDADGDLKGVAVIDWGKVDSGHHPLTDIGILLVDLLFRIRWRGSKADLDWAAEVYAKSLHGAPASEASLVFLTHLCRMLAWRDPEDGIPWFEPAARRYAWALLQDKETRTKWPLFFGALDEAFDAISPIEPVLRHPIDLENQGTGAAPDAPGVFELLRGPETIHFGHSDESIRRRLADLLSGREGSCTQQATHFRYEVTDEPARRERQLLEEYERVHERLPQCHSHAD